MRVTHHRRWAAVVAATGVGALTLGAAGLPAVALETKPEKVELGEEGAGKLDLATIVEPLSSSVEALTQLSESGNLGLVAKRAGMTVDKLTSLLQQNEAVVSSSGFVALVDEWTPENAAEAPDVEPAADVPGNPTEGSKPGASHTIYLDFDGHTVAGTTWNVDYQVGPFELGAYEATDEFKRQLWETVAQDYAPFDVNVTIADPGSDALYKTSDDDETYGAHVVIAADDSTVPDKMQGMGGWAIVGGFGSEYLNPAMVFANTVGENPYYLGTAASHEAGHQLGLVHHGIINPEADGGEEEYYYYETPASPEALWGPIMGAPYTVPMSQWSNGGYADATSPEQDDIATMLKGDQGQRFVILFDQDGNVWTDGACVVGDDPSNPQPGDEIYEPNAEDTCDPLGDPLEASWQRTDRTAHTSDSHGDSTDEASALDNSVTDFAEQGNITNVEDTDVFSFVTDGGSFSVTAAPAGTHSNADLKLTLLDSEGNVVAENEQTTTVDPAFPANPAATGADATIEQELETGAYYLTVKARGEGDPAANTPENGSGYPAYGSLGFYELAGSAAPFEAEPITITAPEDGAEVERSNLEVAGVAEAEADVELTIGDETVGTATADAAGAWSVTLDSDLPYGESTITARQTVSAIEVPETTEVTVTVPVDAPEIVRPEEGATASTATPTFDGTGVAGATVPVAITCGDGSWSGEVTVDEDGNWSFTPKENLPNGDCTVEAVQAVNGVTSPAAGPVGFSVQVDDGNEGGAEDGGADDGGEEGGDEGGDDLPDTGSSWSMLALTAGLVLLAMGGLLYARTRRASA